MCAVGFDAENNDAKNGTAETEVHVRGRHGEQRANFEVGLIVGRNVMTM